MSPAMKHLVTSQALAEADFGLVVTYTYVAFQSLRLTSGFSTLIYNILYKFSYPHVHSTLSYVAFSNLLSKLFLHETNSCACDMIGTLVTVFTRCSRMGSAESRP